jgi:hypothetical protein
MVLKVPRNVPQCAMKVLHARLWGEMSVSSLVKIGKSEPLRSFIYKLLGGHYADFLGVQLGLSAQLANYSRDNPGDPAQVTRARGCDAETAAVHWIVLLVSGHWDG